MNLTKEHWDLIERLKQDSDPTAKKAAPRTKKAALEEDPMTEEAALGKDPMTEEAALGKDPMTALGDPATYRMRDALKSLKRSAVKEAALMKVTTCEEILDRIAMHVAEAKRHVSSLPNEEPFMLERARTPVEVTRIVNEAERRVDEAQRRVEEAQRRVHEAEKRGSLIEVKNEELRDRLSELGTALNAKGLTFNEATKQITRLGAIPKD